MREAPPRGLPIWNMYCARCNRHGQIAMQDWEDKPVDPAVRPEAFFCPDCGKQVEILGRVDQ